MIWLGVFAHHQAMFFDSSVLKNIRYSTKYHIAGDYHLIARVVTGIEKKTILRLSFPICVFKVGGVSSNYLKANPETWEIRRDVLKVPYLARLMIYFVSNFMSIVRKNIPVLYNIYRFRANR